MPEVCWTINGITEMETVDTCVGMWGAIQPHNNVVSLDTETSGLFVDGDWRDGPPARVSVVSLAWDEECEGGYTRVSVALPFDQGHIGGKPGRWSDELDTYETLPHIEECENYNVSHGAIHSNYECQCASWNLGVEDWYALYEWLKGKRLVEHNSKFDSHIMNAGLRIVPGSGVDLSDYVVADTMLAQGILEPLETSALKPTAARKWGDDSRDAETIVKDALKRNGVGLTKRYDLVAWPVMAKYAAKDAELTLRLYHDQRNKMLEGLVTPVDQGLIATELEVAKLLFGMECRGVEFDAEAMRVEAAKMRVEVKRLEAELPFSPPNVNAAKRWFYDAVEDNGLGLTPEKRTPKGAPSLDTEVAKKLAAKGIQGAQEWVDLANYNSALSKWYNAWPYKVGTDGRIRTNFRQGRIESDRKGMTSGGAISGRFSAERVQLQGVPDEYRIPKGIKPVSDLLGAKPGHQRWEIDASNAEVRVAAWLMKSPTLAKACATGNVHSANTVLMFGDLLRETMPLNFEGGIEDHPDWGLYRKIAKTTILGMFFGAGVRTLKAQIDKATAGDYPEREVRKFVDAAMAVVPELKPVSKAMERKADITQGGLGYISLVNGRKRWFGWGEHTYKAFNSGTQGGVAEMIKLLMLDVEKAWPGMLINTVHDSLWLEIPDALVEVVVADVKARGVAMFTKAFSTKKLTVEFEFDAKRKA